MRQTLSEAQLIQIAWQTGQLRYKLHDHQEEIYDAYWNAIENKTILKYVGNISRRYGKSFIALLIAFEYAIRNPGSKIKIACPTQGQMSRIIDEVGGEILKDCPVDLKPVLKYGRYTFKNKSFIQLAGSDLGNSDRLRGTSTDLAMVDEAGFVADLKYLLSSVLLPTMLKVKNGTLLVYSTPPKTKDHYFTQLFYEAKAEGCALLKTIDDDPTMSPEKRQMWAKEYGGADSTEFRREFLCEFITDEEIAVVPEWKDVYETIPERDAWYDHYHKYVGLDIGIRDNTAAIYGYYDFVKGVLVIQGETTMAGNTMTTDILADAMMNRERELWTTCRSPHYGRPHDKAWKRIGDTSNLLLLQDLSRLHGIAFSPVSKDRLHQMVNKLRMWVRAGRVVIDKEKCPMLVGCMQSAYWNTQRNAFGHSKIYAHFDHLAALIYLLHHLDDKTNPIPSEYVFDPNTYDPNGGKKPSEGNAASIGRALLGRRQ